MAVVREQVQSALVAVDRFMKMTEVVIGVADAVPGGRLAVPVTESLMQDNGLPAVGELLLEIAETGVGPADRVECVGLSGPPLRSPSAVTPTPKTCTDDHVGDLALAGNTATDRTATGIDYLRILDDARGHQLARQVNYSALVPTDPRNQHDRNNDPIPGQLDLTRYDQHTHDRREER